ncbi:MAG: PDDEXK nuclease domain-containing protein, partial [Gemmataceae bacterium]
MARKKTAERAAVPAGDVLPAGYAALLEDLKARIRSAQVRAALAVSRELILLYWHIGREVYRRQAEAGWGQKVIERLGNDLQREFPGVQGVSRSNLYRVRAFYQAYSPIVPQPVGQIEPAGPPDLLLSVPWSHNAVILERLGDNDTRLWYARQAAEHGWSRAVLAAQIDGRLHERQGKAVSNFDRALPPADSDLARQLLKDPYHFDFLTLAADARERDLERGLTGHLKRFMLELGVGFAFVGSQHPLTVGGQEFFLDLLFYHCKLHCYFVIDLKMDEFTPE